MQDVRYGLRLILSQSMVLAVLGVKIGIPCALLAARLITHVLFGVSVADPLTFAVAAVVLLAVGILAGCLPARRATRTDPMIALRCE